MSESRALRLRSPNTQEHIQNRRHHPRVVSQAVTQRIRQRQNPLPNQDVRNHAVHQMRMVIVTEQRLTRGSTSRRQVHSYVGERW